MLLGLPAQTSAGIACGRLIVDTGCVNYMVSDKTFTEYVLRANSKKRKNPLRMQTANGIVTLDKELTYEIKKLKAVTSAVVCKNTPDLLSVGYRCQELGYGFHWEPYQAPYIVLPDGKTEVDFHVDQYVPYLLDDGDTAICKSCVSMPCAAFQYEIFDLEDDTTSCCSDLQSNSMKLSIN